jgi:NADH:ubiquinone oxidoreductase subunit K
VTASNSTGTVGKFFDLNDQTGVTMEDNQTNSSTSTASISEGQEGSKDRRRGIIIAIIAVIVLAAFITALVFLIRADPTTTGQIRDIFIILMALESLVIGAALIILIVQVAVLTNLLQNEIKPILDSTSETVNTMKGTVTFLADNLVQPVIRMNAYVAGAKRLVDLIRPGKQT